MNNVVRLAELLTKDSLSVAERREGINLAQAIFGSQSIPTLDSVRIALRGKKMNGFNDPAGVAGRHIVIGAGKDTVVEDKTDEEVELVDSEPGTVVDDLSAEQFSFVYMGAVYTRKRTSNGKEQYRIKSDEYSGFIKADAFGVARKAANGEAESNPDED